MLRKGSLTLWVVLFVLAPVLLLGTVPVRADDHDEGRDRDKERNQGAVRLLDTIPTPGSPLLAFDISWVNSHTRRYYLADRSNAAIDVIDTKDGTFLKQIHASPPFRGFSGSNNTSGPNGVVVSGHWLFATDASSRVVTIDLRTDTTVSDVSTGGKDSNRADELAYDPEDGIILAVNNADDPPFATLISVDKNTGKLTVGKRITFDAADVGFDATNGAEQPVWDPGTGHFYLSIPEIDCPKADPRCGGAFPDGAIAKISPNSTGNVDAEFHVQLCQPAGLTLGPKQDLLLGCSVIFNTAGEAWTGLTDPNSAAPTQVIMDAKTGAIDKVVKGVGGSDEVWFNKGDGNYYTGSRENPGAVLIAGNTPADPVLGVIDADDQTLIQLVPTFDTPAASPAPRGSAHSVAVDSRNNHAFVPLPANNVFPNCLNGCVAVFGTSKEDHN